MVLGKVRAHIAYIDTSKMQTMHKCRNDTLNALKPLFSCKFIPQMT